MGRYNYHQHSFLSGKISKKLRGRLDVKEYVDGLDDMDNMIVMPQGGVTKRPGTKYLASYSEAFELIPFTFSRTEAYLVAISPTATYANRIRVLRVTGVAAAVILPTDFVSNSYGPFFRNYSFNSVANSVETVPTAGGFHHTQEGDVLTITHSSREMEPIVIARTDVNTFKLDLVTYPTHLNDAGTFLIGDGLPQHMRIPYLDKNIDGTITLAPSATAVGAATLTASKAFFTADCVGSYFKLTHTTTTGACRVTSFTSSTVVNIEIVQAFDSSSAAAPADFWAESAWGRKGYPTAIASYGSRRIYGGPLDSTYCSNENNLFHMMQERLIQDQGTSDVSGFNFWGDKTTKDPFSFTPASQEINRIQWISSGDTLQIGTLGAEYIVGEIDGTFGGDNVYLKQQTSHGSSPIQPVRVGSSALYVSRDGKKIRDFKYNRTNGSFTSMDLNMLADDIWKHNYADSSVSSIEIEELTYQSSPSIMWIRTSLGELIGLTYDQQGGIIAFHPHTLGASPSDTAEISSIGVIPSTDGTNDDLYIVSGRDIGGSNIYVLERMMRPFEQETITSLGGGDSDLPWYLDCGVHVVNVPASTTTSLGTFYANEEVYALADGIFVGPFTANGSGDIELSTAAESVIAGFKYKNFIKTVVLNAGPFFGSAMGNIQRIDRVTARLYKSMSYSIGQDDTKMETVNVGTQIVTKDEGTLFAGTPDKEAQVYIEQNSAYPLTILSLGIRGQSYDS